MSSTATSNRRAASQTGRGRNKHKPPELSFTLIHGDSQVEQVILDEEQTVEMLYRIIATRFKIPISKQFVYGWPSEEPRDRTVKFKELNLPSDVLLYVAVDGTLGPEDELISPDADGAVPGPSQRSSSSSNSPLVLDSPQPASSTLQLHVTDRKNNESYNELPFEGCNKVIEVKTIFADLAGIPLEFQKWMGWPEKGSKLDEMRLKDLGLDKPFHSLILDDRRSEISDISSSSPVVQSPSSQGKKATASKVQVEQATASKVQGEQPTASKVQGEQATASKVQNEQATASKVQGEQAAASKVQNEQATASKVQGEQATASKVQNEQATASEVQGKKVTKPTAPKVQIKIEQETNHDDEHMESQQVNEIDIGPVFCVKSEKSENFSILSETELSPPSKPRTARKSTSKGALRDIDRRFNEQRRDDEYDDASNRSWDFHASFASGSSQLSVEIPGPSTPKRTRYNSDCQSPSKARKQHIQALFLSFPDKVTKNLCGFLDPLTMLSLRRVCKTTKEWISGNGNSDFTQASEEKWKNFHVTITGEDHKTFETFVNLNLPITCFRFVVRNEQFYDSADIDSFISFCSLRVKDVTLTKFFMFQNVGERKMFESFVKLENLTIDDLVVSLSGSSPVLPCPAILTNLQVLKLNYEIDVPQENVLIRPKTWDMTWSMLSDCHSLLYFRFPLINETRLNGMGTALGVFAPLLDYIETRFSNGGVSLEYLDLKHFNNPDSFYINRFVDLLRRCYVKDIKLKNVHSLVVQQVFDEDGTVSDEKYKFCENIVSLINYCPFVENAPLRNLEKITIDVVPSVTDYNTLGKGYKDMFWPKLGVIKIKDSVQQNKNDELWSCWQEVQEDLYGHNGIFDRGSVHYIKIDSPKLPYFLSEGRLAQKFYNLKRLEITSWCCNDKVFNKRLHAVWRKLRLEVIRIENCPQLNDSSFVGGDGEDEEDDSQPPFLKLIPTLKKLTLGLDRTDVTDQSLAKVFSRMHLKIFIILSKRPTKIAEPGLLKLSRGEFGKHIEYFPFHCWSSASIDPRRFERLSKNFRSMR